MAIPMAKARMTAPYPLRTEPFFRNYLWGGRKLETALGKTLPDQGVWAESWEMIDHPEHQSKVINGDLGGQSLRDIAQRDADWFFGDQANRPSSLPLLLKYLDCQRVLSVQVHPDDRYASRMTPPDLGKTEAWYIVSTEPGAKLYAGLKSGVTQTEVEEAIRTGTLEACLHVLHPQAGDCVFIPAGTVHALGAGLLVAEIQQASNTTFRLFDWNRVDADGNPRALHVEQALEVIDFERGPCQVQPPQPTRQTGRTRLVQCDKFVLDRLQDAPTAEVAGDSRLHLLTAPHGSVTLEWRHDDRRFTDRLECGQSVLLPASMPVVLAGFEDESVLLDMHLP